MLIGILSFSSAESGAIEKTVYVEALENHQELIESGKGEINYTWTITNFEENDEVIFYIVKEDSNRLGNPETDISNKSDILSVKSGEYTFVWQNNNLDKILNITLNISYPEPKKEIGTGCYSSVILPSITIILILIWTYGYHKKKK